MSAKCHTRTSYRQLIRTAYNQFRAKGLFARADSTGKEIAPCAHRECAGLRKDLFCLSFSLAKSLRD